MPDLKEFLRPTSLEEALTLLAQRGEKARALAGGTALVLARGGRHEAVVSLQELGLDRITNESDGLHVGAMVTLNGLRRQLTAQPHQCLFEAASGVGARVLQNHVTVGGNCVMVYAWSDLPVAAWCLDARFVIQGLDGRRTMDADTFFAQHPTRLLKAGELLVEVVFPKAGSGEGSAHVKLARARTDHAIASASAWLRVTDGRITAGRVVVGGVAGMPQLMSLASEALAGLAPDEGTFLDAGRRVAEDAKTVDDIRGSADYRRAVLPAVVRDALNLAAQRAGGAQ